MAILKIARMGHPVLLQMCEPVANPGAPEIRRLVADMLETMDDAPGVGLAAPQVHVPLRLFVFRVPQTRAGEDARRHDPRQIRADQSRDRTADRGTRAALGGLPLHPRPARRRAARSAHPLSRGGLRRQHRWNARCPASTPAWCSTSTDHLDGILYPMRMKDFSLFGFTEELARVAAAQQEGR